MASRGKNWASKEQRAWLKARVKPYEACIPTRKYESFWKTLYAEWQVDFPMVEELFPGRKFESLSDSEKDQFKAEWTFRRKHPREAGRVRFKSLQFGEPEDSPTLVTYWRDYDRVYGEKVAEYYAEHVLRDTTLEETMGQEVGDSDEDDEDDEDQEGGEDSSDDEEPVILEKEPTASKKANMSGSGTKKVSARPKKSDAATKKSGKSSTVSGDYIKSKGGQTSSEASGGAEEVDSTSSEVSGGAEEVANSGSAKPGDKQQKPRPRPIKKPTKSNIPSNPIPPARPSEFERRL
ncbi:hypothetical protein H1R20_g223, partial [Candolleomyces eurysporus]